MPEGGAKPLRDVARHGEKSGRRSTIATRLGIGDDDFEALDTEIEAIVEGSVEFAKAGTDPKPEDALKYVYA
jgi:TPP-dependent pyruvate/acetoin dehydrogenase alpha subunit